MLVEGEARRLANIRPRRSTAACLGKQKEGMMHPRYIWRPVTEQWSQAWFIVTARSSTYRVVLAFLWFVHRTAPT
jgi:hypothetical protein